MCVSLAVAMIRQTFSFGLVTIPKVTQFGVFMKVYMLVVRVGTRSIKEKKSFRTTFLFPFHYHKETGRQGKDL